MNLIKRILYFFGLIDRKYSAKEEIFIGQHKTKVTINNAYTTPQAYPIVLKSNNGYPIEFKRLDNRNDKGVLEDFFFDYLKRKFLTKVYNSISIKLGQIEITPDIVLIDKERNIFINIEIDEPYTIDKGSLKPIHTISTDDKRNQLLINNGWNVIRFAEKQIAIHPDDCVKLIYNFLENNLICETKIIPCWTFEDAQLMIIEKERDKYLPIEFQDNGRTYSNFSYRSFKITSIGYAEKKDKTKNIIVNLEDNVADQCWIPENIFWNKFKASRMWELIVKYDIPKIYGSFFFSTRNHVFIPFLNNNDWFLNGIGKCNQKYFNLKTDNEFTLECSDFVLNEFEKYIKLDLQKLVEIRASFDIK